MQETGLATWEPKLTVRLRLTLSYAGFLVFAGLVVLAGVYLVLKYGPGYPLGPSIPQREGLLPQSKELALLRVSVVILVSLALLGLVGGWFLAGRMLRPLQAITAAARFAAATGSLTHRIDMPGHRDEFTELADTFDAMLDRLQQSFEEQQRFAANASHELRTPHAVTKTILEVAMADPGGQDIRELLRRLQETNQRGIDIVETLLTLSALSHGDIERKPLRLDHLVEDALETLAIEASEAGVTIDADLEEIAVAGNEVLLHQLVMNLGQNAIRHNLATGGRMHITVRPGWTGVQQAVLVVENTGPALDAARVQTLIEPFVRGQGRVATGGQRRGHGLGLALVARITEVHGGHLALEANPGGGLTVTVALPRQHPVSWASRPQRSSATQ